MDTTYINRGNTNKLVFDKANDKMQAEGKHRKVVTFVEAYQKLKRKRACKLISNPNTVLYSITFQGDKLRKWTHANRRVGQPRLNWTKETIQEIWQHIRKTDDRYKHKAFNGEDDEIIQTIKTYAAQQQPKQPLTT